MTPNELRTRTKRFAISSVRFSESLLGTYTGNLIARQLIRCGTSVGSNYRAASLAKSKADMVSKLKTVEEELDEVAYWLELVEELIGLNDEGRVLRKEQNELFRIVVASIKTLRKDVHG